MYFRGVEENKRSPLDLLIAVCRATSNAAIPKPVSYVISSKRQVKSNVMCSGMLEEGTYMIGIVSIVSSKFEFSYPGCSRFSGFGESGNDVDLNCDSE